MATRSKKKPPKTVTVEIAVAINANGSKSVHLVHGKRNCDRQHAAADAVEILSRFSAPEAVKTYILSVDLQAPTLHDAPDKTIKVKEID